MLLVLHNSSFRWHPRMPDNYESYSESAREADCVRGCGACLFVGIGLLLVTYLFNAIPVADANDAPPFARSLLWLSLAHHTNAWSDWLVISTPPPPPPSFE